MIDMRRKVQPVTRVQFVETALDETRWDPNEVRARHFESSPPSPAVPERTPSFMRMRRMMLSITSLFAVWSTSIEGEILTLRHLNVQQ
jgi:hypothetical protein